MWEVTNNGLKLQDTAEIRAEVQKIFTDIWPQLSLEPSTPQGQLITAITDKIAAAQSSAAELANILFQGGSGVWLDFRNATLFGLSRRMASTNMIDIKIVGTPYYVVKAGFQVSDAEGKHVFTLPKDVIILTDGYIIATFTSDEDLSHTTFAIGDINTPLDSVPEIQSVSNTSFLFRAREAESDGEYYLRAEQSKYYRAASITSAGLAYVRQTSGVTRATVYENYTDLPTTYKGISMPRHSVTYAVEGGDAQDIATAILMKKNPGAALGGDVKMKVMDNTSGQMYDIAFYRVAYKPVYVTLTVKRQLYDNLNYKEQVLPVIEEYLNSMQIGEDLYATKIVADLDVPFLMRSLLVYPTEDRDTDGTYIESKFNECFQISIDNIQVVTL